MNCDKRVDFLVKPARKVSGEFTVPGDKSISHRSVMLGAIAEGKTLISGFLEGEDNLATLKAFRAMGVAISDPVDGALEVEGVGLFGLKAPDKDLYLGNSGTSMRLLSGLLSPQSFDCVLTGDESLSKRPMRRVTEPLSKMGAKIETTVGGTAPLRIRGTPDLQGVHYEMPVASAQVKSCLMLAGLYARGITSVTEPAPTRDHTERMLAVFNRPVSVESNRISLEGGKPLYGCEIQVPADISSAAFFLVAGSIADTGSELLIRNVGMNPTRTGVIDILRLMGAQIEVLGLKNHDGEPSADLCVRPAKLRGINIPESLVPLAIDEFPAIFIAAACADGETVLTGAEELRVKESDRIQSMADGLATLGIDVLPTTDGIRICGGRIKSRARIETYGDHRIAMAFAVASLAAEEEITLLDCANVNTSFPGFVELSNQLGLNISVNSYE